MRESETRHLDPLGQLGGFEQDSNSVSEDVLQQRRGSSTGFASLQSSSRKTTLNPSRKATQTRECVSMWVVRTHAIEQGQRPEPQSGQAVAWKQGTGH